MENNKSKNLSLINIFITFFKINAITFGGGYTIVPVISDIYVNEKKLIPEDDMMDIVAIAQSGPGAMAISASILTGYKLRGFIGALVALVASASPCLIILSIIANFYNQFRDNFYINSALNGISGIISAVLLLTVFNMAKNSYKKYPIFTIALIILIFYLGYFLKINTAYLILLCGFLGIIVFYLSNRRNKSDS
ncbi:MAG: chromate transporter [Peptoniphilaceae bacterium]